MTRIVAVVALTALWLLLWRDVSVANVVSGAVAAALVTANLTRSAARSGVRPLTLLRFLAYFGGKLIEANVVLAREVVTPQNVINTGIIAVRLPECTDLVLTIVANAISLTPGTLTLEVDRRPEPIVFVHVLHLHDLDDARADVLEMARRARAAFPATTPEAVG